MNNDFKNASLGVGSLLVFTSEVDFMFWQKVVLITAVRDGHYQGITINAYDNEILQPAYRQFIEGGSPDLLANKPDAEKTFRDGGPVGSYGDADCTLTVISETLLDGASKPTLKIIKSGTEGAKEAYEALAAQKPENAFITLGYAGWGPGQLEQEITQYGAWRVLPYNRDLVFNTPKDQVWAKAAKLAGIDDVLADYIKSPKPYFDQYGIEGANNLINPLRPAPLPLPAPTN